MFGTDVLNRHRCYAIVGGCKEMYGRVVLRVKDVVGPCRLKCSYPLYGNPKVLTLLLSTLGRIQATLPLKPLRHPITSPIHQIHHSNPPPLPRQRRQCLLPLRLNLILFPKLLAQNLLSQDILLHL